MQAYDLIIVALGQNMVWYKKFLDEPRPWYR